MNIKIVYDNYTADSRFLHGWGFSALINNRVLFDCGEEPSSILHNLAQFHCDVSAIEAVVISHEHWDHIGALDEIVCLRQGLRVYVCPGFSSGFKSSIQDKGGIIVECADFTEIDTDLSLTGEIPSVYKGEPMPEQALMIKKNTGITLITGCSHPGIITMIEKAQSLYPAYSIDLVLGGFHLKDETEEAICSIARQIKDRGVKKTAPTHCSGDTARAVFFTLYGADFIKVSAGAEVNF